MALSVAEIKSQLITRIPELEINPVLGQVCEIAAAAGCDDIAFHDNDSCRELRAMYDAFYAGLFRRHSPLCTTAHFHREGGYVGYSKIYPIRGSTIGETALPFQDRTHAHLACWDYVSREVDDVQKYVITAPFMQQDGNCGVCAQVALWMALRVIGSRYGKQDVSVPDITRIAAELQDYGPSMPASGLFWWQLTYVVRRLGYTPMLEGRPEADVWYPDGVIYRHIESGLPVVLGLGNLQAWHGHGHAVTVVGHVFETMALQDLPSAPYHTPATFMRSFLVNDDQLGPYVEMPKQAPQPNMALAGGTPYDLQTNGCWVLGILPQQVHLNAEDAEVMAFAFIRYIAGQAWYQQMTNHEGDSLRDYVDGTKLVLRTFLTHRQDWRRERMSPQVAPGLPTALEDLYRTIDLPDDVWAVEISTVELYSSPAEGGKRLIIGEVIVDPTALDDTEAVLLLHVPGLVVYAEHPSRIDSLYEFAAVPEDHRYAAAIRPKERRTA